MDDLEVCLAEIGQVESLVGQTLSGFDNRLKEVNGLMLCSLLLKYLRATENGFFRQNCWKGSLKCPQNQVHDT